MPHVIVYIVMNNKEARHQSHDVFDQIYVYAIHLWSVLSRKVRLHSYVRRDLGLYQSV